MKKPRYILTTLDIILLVCYYICDKSRIFSALAVKNIEASFIFLARLLLYLHSKLK